MQFKKIRTKLLVFILPVIVLSMVVLAIISAASSKRLISEQIKNYMSSELNAQMHSIELELDTISATSMNIAKFVGSTYKNTSLSEYEYMLDGIISENDVVLGSGVWFEPYVFDTTKEYVGPYVYKDGDLTRTTYDYSNKEYNYFEQEYYMNAKSSKTAVITDPYFDETSGLIMASCSAPILNNGAFIGCITVDIELTSIQSLVKDIKVGENGDAILLSSSGVYLGNKDDAKVEASLNINDDTDKNFAQAGKSVLAQDQGFTSYTTGNETYNLYYSTVEGVGWKLLLRMPVSELNEPVYELLLILSIVCLIAIILSIVVIVILVRYWCL